MIIHVRVLNPFTESTRFSFTLILIDYFYANNLEIPRPC